MRLALAGPRLALRASLIAIAVSIGAGGLPGAAQPEPDTVTDAAPRGPSAAERLEEIRRRVQAAVVYPPIAHARGVAGETRVAFRILADGRPDAIRTAGSSGSATLDRAAEQAVTAAAPFPPMIGQVVVPVRFVLRDPD
jgi:TonB family protein